MITLDFEFRTYCALLTIAFGIYALFRRPAANIWIGFSVIGIGPEKLLNLITFGRFILMFQIFAIVYLLMQIMLERKLPRLLHVIGSVHIYPVVLILVWLKVSADCLVFGLDDYRVFALKNACYGVFLPTIIFLLAYVKDGLPRTLKGILLGALLFPCAYLLPLVYPILIEGRLISAAFGEDRLTTFGQDTINGGRMFFVGCIGFFFAAMMFNLRNGLRILLLAVGLLFFSSMLLNGTRQYIIAAIMAFAAALFLTGRLRQLLWLALVVAIGLGFYSVRSFYSEAKVSQRVERESLTTEMMAGRGRIWAEALSLSIQNPLLGVGFRNFGEEFTSVSPETGDVAIQKDNAHGFFQDVYVEHGFVLGTFLFIAWLILFVQFFRWNSRTKDKTHAFLMSVLSVFAITETFSGGVFNCLGFHLFAVAALIQSFERSSIKAKLKRPAPVPARPWIPARAN